MVPGRSGSDPTVMRELVLLLATDGSPGAAVARSAALDLAGGGGWPLHVVHVWQPPVVFPYLAFLTPPDFPRAYQEQGESILLEERHQVENGGGTVSGTHLVEGRPADTILRVAEEVGNALLVIGSRGLGRLERLALGTVSEEVLHHSHRPVLVTRGGSGHVRRRCARRRRGAPGRPGRRDRGRDRGDGPHAARLRFRGHGHPRRLPCRRRAAPARLRQPRSRSDPASAPGERLPAAPPRLARAHPRRPRSSRGGDD